MKINPIMLAGLLKNGLYKTVWIRASISGGWYRRLPFKGVEA